MPAKKKADTKWQQPATPPPPLFTGEKERNLVKQINDELIERVIGQQVLYFSIDVDRSNFHPLYGEVIQKTFLPPIRIHALVKWEGQTQLFTEGVGIDKATSIEIHFHKKRLTQDQDVFVREGDFVLYGDRYYEIVNLSEPKQLFGQIENKFEIVAKCIRAREGIFNPQFTANTVTPTRLVTPINSGSSAQANTNNDIIYNNLTVNNLTVNNSAIFNGSIAYKNVLISGSYSVTSTDYLIGVNTNTITSTITLPSVSLTNTGRTIVIKDETGNASINYIYVSASSGQTIDGDSSIVIDSDHISITLYCTLTGWHVI
jgi:hypothetical protein